VAERVEAEQFSKAGGTPLRAATAGHRAAPHAVAVVLDRRGDCTIGGKESGGVGGA